MRKKINRFTLMELMAAMAVLTIVGALAASTFAAFLRGWERSNKIAAELREYRAIDSVADNLLRNMIPFQWLDGNNEKHYLFEGLSNEIFFTARRRNYEKDKGALVFVRLRLENGDLVALYSFYPRLQWDDDADDPEKWTKEVLATKVRNLSFLYAESDSEKTISFLDEWVEDDHHGVPLATQMLVEWESGRKERWLRRSAGSAADSVLGNRQTSDVL
ncbi:MAG: hypothetical protein PHS41_04055 [Victivallaceae bacterium]|nr:hypothetical protein [Victivallaceae bacterium]